VSNNLILITNTIDSVPTGGREKLCKLNYDSLKEIFSDNFTAYQLEKKPVSGIKEIIRAFKGYIDGLTVESLSDVVKTIQKNHVDTVFVDGSNFGHFVKNLRKKFPNVRIFTFFHNVESKFFWDSFKRVKSLKALAIFMVNYLAEKKSVKYSHRILCINERDSQLLEKTYGKPATDIYPMSLADTLPNDYESLPTVINEPFALFVGGDFYANRVGVFWFVENVVPHIKLKTYIVGKGFERYKRKLEINEKVIVVGEVESLTQWYHDANFVIAPIFDGSGMKTKVAEALMYGKKVIGSKEAFVGYEDFIDMAGTVCDTVEDFVSVINSSGLSIENSFDLELRKIYEENYSNNAAKSRLKNILMQ
jgi:glycosyltransferase involved in cell wall biosynthesis